MVRRESELDELAISGDDNMGSDFYPVPFKERRIALETGPPVTILPQTLVGNDENLAAYKKI